MKRRTRAPLPLGIGAWAFLLTAGGTATAQDDVACALYARTAVREGSYTVLAVAGANRKQSHHTLRGFPHWSIGAGEQKVLDGVTLPFAEENVYYHPGSWQLDHPDDSEPANDLFVNRTGVGIRGSEFLTDPELRDKRCLEHPPTPCDKPSWLDVTVRLRTLEVLDEGDAAGNAEPYLFPLYFKVASLQAPEVRFDGEQAPVEGSWLHAPGGGHGNLGTGFGAGFAAGERIQVPREIGRWRTTLPIALEGQSAAGIYVTAVALLLEEDLLPSSAAVRELYAHFTRNAVSHLDLAWPFLLNVPLPSNEASTRRLEEAFARTLAEQEPPIPVDLDDLIGVAIFSWSLHELSADSYRVLCLVRTSGTGSQDGAYAIVGDVIARPVCLVDHG